MPVACEGGREQTDSAAHIACTACDTISTTAAFTLRTTCMILVLEPSMRPIANRMTAAEQRGHRKVIVYRGWHDGGGGSGDDRVFPAVVLCQAEADYYDGSTILSIR